MSRKSTIENFRIINAANDSIVEYCDSSEWALKDLRSELRIAMDNAEESEPVDDVEPAAWEIFAGLLTTIIKVRMEKPFTEAELNTIAGV